MAASKNNHCNGSGGSDGETRRILVGVDPRISELLELPDNELCADCQAPGPTFISFRLGIFVCERCSKIHSCLGAEFNYLKPLDDTFTNEIVKKFRSMGNNRAKEIYEKQVPACYKRPKSTDAMTLVEQWIRAKYERQEFVEGAPSPSYLSGAKDGYLYKRGKADRHFKRRRFILACNAPLQHTLKYYNKESAKEPKAVMRVDELNVLLAPEKIGHPNGIHIMFTQDDYTRSIYVYAETGQEAIDWFTALRSAKLNRLAIAFPSYSLADLCGMLSEEHVKEGWLMKAGPKAGDAYRQRWVTLDRRKLSYYEDPLSAFPKGEVSLSSSDAYAVCEESVDSSPVEFCLQLRTPQRVFHFGAETSAERAEWIATLRRVLNTPCTAHDRVTPVKPKREGTLRESMMKVFIKR